MRPKSALANPWIQLIIGLICMAAVANMQYGWTLFVDPLDSAHGWGRPAIQFAFTIFVFLETWLVPVEGYLVDRFGPRWVVIGGAILVAVSWVMNSQLTSLAMLYVAAAIGGTGTGAVYGTCVGNALKWFPGRRGLAAGITAAGFGAGAAFTIVPISKMIASSGYQHAFLFFGLLQGAIVFVMAWGLVVAPKSLMTAAVKPSQTSFGYSPSQVLQSPVFYVMYVMFFLIAAGGLTMAASMAPIAKDFGLAKTPVALFGFVLPALAFALALNRIFDGVGRPFFGWVSDHIGRENTMAIAFLIGALALFGLTRYGTNPVSFVLISAVYFGVYGEIFSLFPATQGDTFGAKYATANAGMLYTAKGAGALVVAYMTSVAHARGWNSVFTIFVVFNIIAAVMALLVLKPMRARHFAMARVGEVSAPAVSTPTTRTT
jgi:OFA family oxalate/formate antiporter-like MFS transporter